MLGSSEDYIKLLLGNEDWLMSRVLMYAKKQGYAKYTSTLQEAWRLSISGLTESLVMAVKTFDIVPPELNPDASYTDDPVSRFGVIEAKRHRERGVTLSMFLGLMKYYRQSYLDLINASGNSKQLKQRFNLFTDRCFDRIEIGYVNEWTHTPEEKIFQELQDTNRKIVNEKNRYLTIFESLFAPIILLDDHNKIVNFNLAASRLFTDIKIAGTLYYNKEQASEALQIVEDKLNELVKSNNELLKFETYINTNVGERYFQVLLKKMLDVSEKFKGTIIMLDDLTNRIETEKHLQIAKVKAEEADRLKTAFLANMSHEIRTPMNAIIGFTELLISSSYNKKERKDYLNLIRKSSADLLNIIEDIIDVAKIESKQIRIKYKICNPFDILQDLQAVYYETLRRYGTNDDVELIIKVKQEERNITLYTDCERLKQVMTNLLNNAAKFTSKGFIEFGYKVVNQANIFFFVRDTGRGVPPGMKDKIFDRFVQVEKHNDTNCGGAGLGLAICKNIINLMGGKIWVESEEGKGSVFYFQLPIREVPNEIRNKVGQLKESENAIIDLSDKVLLVAEDDNINYIYLNEILKKTGAKILWAKNGLEAINLVESEEHIDLILMDIKMPEVDGLEASRYISGIKPEIPIIAQTALAVDGDKSKCLSAGCSAYITKPIESKNLFLLIRNQLMKKKNINKVIYK
ncbi:MAG: response regulator [Bacteroidales bacterium]|nr:response regulator [Bacteroidales bacterium]